MKTNTDKMKTNTSNTAVKILAGFMAVLAMIYFLPAFMHMQGGRAIRGSTIEQLNKSAKQVRKNMSTSDRNLFDTAYGILETIKLRESPEAFAKAVNGLTPEEVIELAKREFDIQVASGQPEFKKYTSWDDMVTKQTSEPIGKKSSSQSPMPLRQSERTGRPN